MTALKKIVPNKQVSIFQLKLQLQTALACVSVFNMFLFFFLFFFFDLKCRELSKITIKDSYTNTIDGAAILKTLPTDV